MDWRRRNRSKAGVSRTDDRDRVVILPSKWPDRSRRRDTRQAGTQCSAAARWLCRATCWQRPGGPRTRRLLRNGNARGRRVRSCNGEGGGVTEICPVCGYHNRSDCQVLTAGSQQQSGSSPAGHQSAAVSPASAAASRSMFALPTLGRSPCPKCLLRVCTDFRMNSA